MPIHPFQLKGMQYRAVAGKLVVFIKRVPASMPVGPPYKHLLKSDEGQLAVDCHLGHRPLLHTMGPAPQDAVFLDLMKILDKGLGEKHDITALKYLLAACQSAALSAKLFVCHAEGFTIAFLKHDVLTQILWYANQMLRMNSDSFFILFARCADDPKFEHNQAPHR